MTEHNEDVVGFLVQCQICPQQVITRTQHQDWVCPRCAEVVADLDDVVDAEIYCGGRVDGRDCRFRDGHDGRCLPETGTRSGWPTGWGDTDVAAAEPVDDEYPIGQVQG